MLHHIENHIENMRAKPHHIKKQYALGVSLGVTLVIFGFWLVGMRSSSEVVADSVEPMKPVKALTANVSQAFDYVKSYFVSSNKAEYKPDNVEVLPGKI